MGIVIDIPYAVTARYPLEFRSYTRTNVPAL